jgi:transcriptional regulator with XRE-family HTH domain
MTEKEYLKRLGKRITSKREALGLSREVFAQQIKLTRMHLYRIENGNTHTTITVLRRIAIALEMNLGELVSFD